MQFGTDAVKGWTKKQLNAKYVEVRNAVFATEYGKKFKDVAHFDEFVQCFVQGGEKGIRLERNILMIAFGQFHHALTKTKFLPPSEETLAWGGFLGGEFFHDTKDADEACWKLLNS